MDQSKIAIFLSANGRYFKTSHMESIKQILSQSDDNKYLLALSLDYKDPNTMLAISILGGMLGIDRFMINDIGMGIGKLLTFGGCGLWAIIDIFLIQDATKDSNYRLFIEKMTLKYTYNNTYSTETNNNTINNSGENETPKNY